MNSFYLDILDQPQALRDLVNFYQIHDTLLQPFSIPPPHPPILTGMGASFHAAWVATQHLYRLGIFALSLEATDVLLSRARRASDSPLVYVSQSGSSAEIAPLLAQLKNESTVIAVTNDVSSPLARHAKLTLPLIAGKEEFVATKTYLNSLAVLWMLVRAWGNRFARSEIDTLERIADACENLLTEADAICARWLDTFQNAAQIIFIGAGPHAATARQAAMTLAEWAKVPALAFSAGAFRHGFIESVERGVGVILFAAPGASYATTISLAQELREYGARVLLVSNGQTLALEENGVESENADEFLAPILDILPAQLFAEALARARNVPPGFRYIGKVITTL